MRTRIAALALIALSATLLFADHPTKERGFRPDAAYQFTELDTINLFNGSVNISLPIGQPYPVSSNLGYAFTLRYAGNVWSEIEVCGGKDGENCHIHYRPQRDNAGFGWDLSFGELEYQDSPIPIYKLVTPDGSKHRFYDTLHPGETAIASIRYTRDSSYLRMTEPSATTKLVEFPNGTRHLYQKDDTLSNLSYTKYNLRYIYDSFSSVSNGVPTSNYVQFDYTYTTDATGTWISQWTITDTAGRTHRVYFRSASSTSPPLLPVVDKIDLQAFNGVRAIYDLGYNNPADDGANPLQDGAPQSVSRPCRFTDDTATITAHFLHKIRLTKGDPSSSSEPFTTFTLTYDEGTTPQCRETPALMTSMTLPTGGRYEWRYRAYNFAGAIPYDASVGVEKRLVYDKNGNLVQFRTYTGDGTGSNIVRTMKVPGTSSAETNSVDFKSVNYFQVDLGLPYTTVVNDGSPQQRYLSSETFDCNENSSTESCTATPERRQYVKYDFDCSVNAIGCEQDRNSRLFSERTQYTSDGSKVADTERTSFDGLGHYRIVTASGTFDSGNDREEITNYNPAAGTYPGSFTMLTSTDPWVLETYDMKSSTEGSVTATSQFCFDGPTGRLKRFRVLAGNSAGASDLLTVFNHDSNGNVITEQYYGGDSQSLGTTSLCGLTLPSADQYRIDHTYQYGMRNGSEYRTAANATVGFKFADYDIDLSTGVIKTSRDTAGLSTAYEFDALGRLVWELPQNGHDAYTEVQYTPVIGTARAKINVRKRPNNNRTGTALLQSEYQYDSLGRLFQERKLMPDGNWSLRETGYDWAGRKAYVTETGQDTGTAPSPRTTYSYDLFGRPTTITPPDGAAHNVTAQYAGVRSISRTAKVNMASGETNATTTEIYDRQGRLWQVKEAVNTASEATTQYGYDVGNRLSSVSMTEGATTQTRTFTYDRRGLLTSEIHPESGTASYQYDARGHVTSRASSMSTLTYQYDRAERLLKVLEGALVWKEFTYDRANSTGDLSMGKVATAKRLNRSVPLGDVNVTETFTYGALGGRISRKDTQISDGKTFVDQYTYTPLGLIDSVTYPNCSSCAPAVSPARTVSNTYTEGLLTRVGNYTSATSPITYHPNGLLKAIRHQNVDGSDGPNYTQTIANEMARPDSISTSNFCDTLQITQHPQPRTVSSGSQAGLTVTTNNATTFQWYERTGTTDTLLAGQTTGTLTVTVTQTSTYWVRVGNGSCTIDSNLATVTVTSCGATATVSGSATIYQSNSTTIQAVLTGTGPWSIQWSDQSSPTTVTSSPVTRSVSPVRTTTYTLTSFSDANCSGTTNGQAVVTVIPPTPTQVNAEAISTTQVRVTWSYSGTADSFDIYRDYAKIGSATSSPFIDGGAAPSTAHVYQVLALAGGTTGSLSAPDLATTVLFADDPLVPQSTIVTAQQFYQLRTAVNAVRALASLPPATFTDATLAGLIIKTYHVQELRTALNPARQALVLPAIVYTQPTLTPGITIIKAVDVNDLRGGVK